MKDLTLKQARILAFVRERLQEIGAAPTVREICTETGTGPCTVYRHLEALVKKGHLTKDRYAYRGLRLPGDPCCGECGRPLGRAKP